MDTPSAPAAPDPTATATGQAKANVATAIANTTLGNADVYSPLGSSTYKQIGTTSMQLPDGTSVSVPRYENTVSLSQGQQSLYDNDLRNQTAQAEIQGDLMQGVRSAISNPAQTPTYAQGYDSGGQIQSSVPTSQAATGFGQTAGAIQYGLGNTDFTADRDATTNAQLARLQPGMDQQSAALEAKLANQGVAQGSSAWNSAMLSNAQGQNDLRLGAVQTGNAEQQALFQQKLASGQFNNAAQQQDYTQQQGRGTFANSATAQNNAAALASGQFANAAQSQQNGQNAAAATFGNQAKQAQYQTDVAGQNQDLNMMSALQSGSQVSMPQFSSFQGGQVAQTPYADSVYKSASIDQQNYQSELQSQQSMMSGLFGMGSKMMGLFGMSDRRLKRDVQRLGRMPNGLALYSWHYLWGGPREVGFMADEVAAVMPEAVAVHLSGFLMVDYGRAAA